MSIVEKNKNQILIAILMLIAAFSRLIPHPPNFTPLTAIALFGGIYLSSKTLSYLVPIIIMLFSDLFLGFSSISLFVYFSFIIISYIGIKSKKPGIQNIVLSSIVFFVVSNFGVWILGYPKTWEGFLKCYTLAIPFFRNSLLGDLFYSGVMILSYNLSSKYLLNISK